MWHAKISFSWACGFTSVDPLLLLRCSTAMLSAGSPLPEGSAGQLRLLACLLCTKFLRTGFWAGEREEASKRLHFKSRWGCTVAHMQGRYASSEACSRCFDLLGWSWEVLAHAVLEDDGLVLVRHASVHHRAVPVALYMCLADHREASLPSLSPVYRPTSIALSLSLPPSLSPCRMCYRYARIPSCSPLP